MSFRKNKSGVGKMQRLHMPQTKAIDIEFQDISLRVSVGRKGKKDVVKEVSGKFKSGELTAIMGPSGAGKTSLLNILTGFQVTGTTGLIRSTGPMENIKTGTKQYKKHSCYILQDDNLDPLFSVKEVMNIAANLKLGESVSPKSKEFLINDILETLGLKVCENTRSNRLSGGQKKRLSVALELIDNPPVMFLDEPTTGLDSLSSLQCITMLKSLAQEGRNIICTIHTPSASLYEMFDHVYVLAQGKCVYQGDSLKTVEYLATSGLVCPQYHNPADYLLEVANCEYGNFTDYLSDIAIDTDRWRKDTRVQQIQMEIKEKDGVITTVNTEPSDIEDTKERYTPPELYRLMILIKRSTIKLYRDWTLSFLRLFLTIVIGLFLGLFFYNFGNDASKTVNNVGYLVISLVYLAYTACMPAVLKFPSEIAMIRKERFNNWYNLKTYYAAFLLTDIPMHVAFGFGYLGSSYFLTGQPLESTRFFMTFGVLFLVSMVAGSIGMFFGTIVNPINGTFLSAIFLALMLSVAGFLCLLPHMPAFMNYISYVSFFSYSMEAMLQSIYGYDRSSMPCPEEVDYCHYKLPAMVLKEFGMTKQTYWTDLIFLVGNVVILRYLAYCTLKKKLSSA